ncbi:MAG: 50S ribosomal protein L35 [Kiritimatiellae bacterium]|nr:50S ribosomal protein L35 [Kiritimatiellia bacterium]
MPKMKTKRSIAKRFKKTATGKLKHSSNGRRHLASSKTTKQKRHLRKASTVSAAFEKRISVLMG